MKDLLTVFILDDEEDAIFMLKSLLHDDERVEVIGSSTEPPNAIIQIKKLQPDVLFLDINMPVFSGIDILKVRSELSSGMDVVLFTAHQEYAIETIKYNPFDLLLKPVAPDVLNNLINSLIEHRKKPSKNHSLFVNKLVIHNKGEAILIDHMDIICITAEGNYTNIMCRGHKEHTISKQLGYVQEKVDPDFFYRINRSQVVNINYLQEVDFKNNSLILRWDEYSEKFRVSRNNLKEIKKLLNV